MRSIWTGHIRFSLVNIPIQIFSAIESKNSISFRQLHDADKGRVGYKKVCKVCEEEVPHKNIVKGFEYEAETYVVFTPKELDAITLKSTRSIEIEAFVDINEVHPSRYESLYYAGPKTEADQKTFSLFIQTLHKTQKAAIGRIILREKEDVVLLTPKDSGLIIYKLRYPYELRDVKNVPQLKEIPVKDEELALAEQLVASLSMPFSKVSFEDRYKDALMELVDAKIKGKEIVHEQEPEDSTPVVDIMSVLKASIEESKKLKKGA